MIVLDTHAAVWFTTADPALGPVSQSLARPALDNDQLAVSAVSFWEIALLIAKGRLRSLGAATVVHKRIIDAGIIEIPLSGEIAILAVDLDDLHGDPADRFIAATAIANEATLMTADKRLLNWRHKMNRQDATK